MTITKQHIRPVVMTEMESISGAAVDGITLTANIFHSGFIAYGIPAYHIFRGMTQTIEYDRLRLTGAIRQVTQRIAEILIVGFTVAVISKVA